MATAHGPCEYKIKWSMRGQGCKCDAVINI